MFLKDISYAHQGCIYFGEKMNTVILWTIITIYIIYIFYLF